MNSVIEKKAYQLLIDLGKFDSTNLGAVFQRAEKTEEPFSKLVVQEGIINEEDLLKIYSNHFKIPFVQLKHIQLDPPLIEKIPVKFAWYYKFFPVSLSGKKLTVAVSRLIDVRTLDEMRFGLGYEIDLQLALEKDIDGMLKSHYGVGSDTVDRMLKKAPVAGQGAQPEAQIEIRQDVEDLEKMAENASVIQLVNQIILDAYRRHASDIHFEPMHGNRVRFRYRIDGILQEAKMPAETNRFFNAILSRIKIMANLNVVERRLPQDGKARVKVQQEMIDLRVSSIPTPYGESMVLRILPAQKNISLDQIGFEGNHLKNFKDLIAHPHGIIFVTGPTGSGKSTTLYAALNLLNKAERKIITIEDPVEYDMDGITQIQVQPDIGLSFARGLKSVLRHDPDVMMIGEVRDLETADIAIRISLTGHLILSTLHTNDAASGVTRLLEVGVEPYLVASSVLAFIGQRLVRTVCKHCKEPDKNLAREVLDMIRADLKIAGGNEITIYHGKGCDSCNGTGFQGRVAIHEIMNITEPVRKLIFDRATAETIKTLAVKEGMQTMRQDGWRKVLAGLTVPSEIIRVTPDDEQKPEAAAEVQEDPAWPAGMLHKTDEAYIEAPAVPSGFERRKYARIKIQFRITFRVLEETEAAPAQNQEFMSQQGLTQDLSAGGVAFCSEQAAKAGDVLEMRINLDDRKPDIECIAKVLRAVNVADESKKDNKQIFKIAACFMAIHSRDRLRIEEFCKGRVEG